MRILRMHVVNLFSYKNAELPLEGFNVIVGPNGSGKTNLIRILERFYKPDLQPDRLHSISLFHNVVIDPQDRFDENNDSLLWLDIEFSDREVGLLLGLIFGKKLDDHQYDGGLKKCSLILAWKASTAKGHMLDAILFRFGNGLSVISERSMSPPGSLTHFACGEVPPDTQKILQLLKPNVTENEYQNEKGVNFTQAIGKLEGAIINNEDVRNWFVLNDGRKVFMDWPPLEIQASGVDDPQSYASEYTRYLNADSGLTISFWTLVGGIINKNLGIVQNLRPKPDELAKTLFDLKNHEGREKHYCAIKCDFEKMFNGITFDVLIPRNSDKLPPSEGANASDMDVRVIKVKEGEKTFPLDRAASAYLEVLYTFSKILEEDRGIVVLDEPAMNLHPVKVRYLSKLLAGMSEKVNRQVIIITHSPYFLDVSLLSDVKRNIIYVKRDKNDGSSKIFTKKTFDATGQPCSCRLKKNENCKIDIKPHKFFPGIFFAKCCIFVEGPSDAAALGAISDSLDNVFDVNDIFIVGAGGKDIVDKYVCIIEAYDIPHIAMVDHDYLCDNKKRGTTCDFVILIGKLENELCQLGSVRTANSVDADDAYITVCNAMKQDRKKVRGTMLGCVVDRALEKAGVDPQSIWNSS
jgi:energy-coupling factor transporter ATP-binding protein EcfA2